MPKFDVGDYVYSKVDGTKATITAVDFATSVYHSKGDNGHAFIHTIRDTDRDCELVTARRGYGSLLPYIPTAQTMGQYECTCDNPEVIKNTAAGKEFFYCRGCKREVPVGGWPKLEEPPKDDDDDMQPWGNFNYQPNQSGAIVARRGYTRAHKNVVRGNSGFECTNCGAVASSHDILDSVPCNLPYVQNTPPPYVGVCPTSKPGKLTYYCDFRGSASNDYCGYCGHAWKALLNKTPVPSPPTTVLLPPTSPYRQHHMFASNTLMCGCGQVYGQPGYKDICKGGAKPRDGANLIKALRDLYTDGAQYTPPKKD